MLLFTVVKGVEYIFLNDSEGENKKVPVFSPNEIIFSQIFCSVKDRKMASVYK